MISQRALRARLVALSARGTTLSDQMAAVAAIATRSSVPVASLLGPVALLDDLYARGMMTGLAWVMRDAEFPTLPLDVQRAVLQQAALWAALWGYATTLPLREAAPTVESLRAVTPSAAGVAVGVQLEQLTSAATLAGLSLADFWATSADTQIALGRLGGYDFALSLPAEDPTAYWDLALNNMAPQVPDVEAALVKLGAVKSPTYVDVLTRGSATVRVSSGSSLQQIAAHALGDANQWAVIAQLNNLRAPYISEDPAAQLGAERGNRVVASLAVAGSTMLTLTDVSGLLVDQRLGIRFGDNWQSVTITAIAPATQTVTVTPALAFSVTPAAVITVYNPTYDVVGRVLTPGDYVVLPTDLSRTGDVKGVLLQRGDTPSEAGLYGVDIATTAEGNLAVTNGDLARATGMPNLSQALAHRFQTPRGSLPYHPLYGSDLHRFLGTRLVAYLSFLGAIDARQTLLRDPRAHEVTGVTVAVNGDRMQIEATVQTAQQEQFPLRVEVTP